MNYVVIDTNVMLVADERAEQMAQRCRDVCLSALNRIKNQCVVVLDDGYRIVREYAGYFGNTHSIPRTSGQEFYAWLMKNRANPQKCRVVHITLSSDTWFEEIPRSSGLDEFDRDDLKFVAVSIAHWQCYNALAPVYNASDTDWLHYEQQLLEIHVPVEQLCRDELQKCVASK